MIFPFFSGYGLYFLFSLPALLLGLWAQMKVKSAFNKYSRVRSILGLTGAEVARRMLNTNGLYNVQVEEVNGFLSDHYDPAKKVLRLSPDIYRGNSIASAGVAAHEAGHALQDRSGYLALRVRSFMVPSVQIGSWLGPIIFFIGLLLASPLGTNLAWAGLVLFTATALFSVVTLPVEIDASNRAKAWLANSGVIHQQEMSGVRSVLDAAALTYVAAAIQAISTVLYYAFILLGRPRRS
jgi:Zn-dependent membrane protease YugP